MVLFSVTACSSDEAGYDLPAALCGINVPRSVLKPALPSGQNLTQHPQSTGTTKRCRIHVDGRSVLSASVERWEGDTTPEQVAQAALSVDPSDTKTRDGLYIYSSTGAVGKVNCPVAEARQESTWASVRVSRPDSDADDILKLVKAYAKAVGESSDCAR
ncbi:hypothetical protein ACIQVC_33040 [Streptomyces sp. NPDC101112]|uniref:hypothetical protein n=1 Tax=Streptomyces sp. NPDC101112 TaxID=3366105 RepID=UPI003825FFBA